MTIKEKTITQIIDGGYLGYAMYVLESRAIPSVVDGQKTVNRKLIYAMLNEHGGKKTKVVDLGSISKFNYHHGETSATEAASNMAATWNNNAPLFEQHGNFGSRLVQEPSSPRYIHASLSTNFKKFFIDEEVAPPNFDTENPEPAYYLPIIPWVLVNGVSGIAVGFKCDIMPRSIKDVLAATKGYLKNPTKFLKENAPIPPTFPNFRGTVEQRGDNQWKTRGIIEFVGKNTFHISELPWGYDRATYVTLLNELCDKDLIKDYSDECSKVGFGFKVKVTASQKVEIDKDPYKYFTLDKIHTEILTTMGIDGKLKIFQSVAELIGYFCDFRTTKFQDKIEYDKAELKHDIIVAKDKRKFLSLVINDAIDFKKINKSEMLKFIADNVTDAEHGKQFMNIPLYACTVDAISALDGDIVDMGNKLLELDKITPIQLFTNKLNGI